MKLRSLYPLAAVLAVGGVAAAKGPIKLPNLKPITKTTVPTKATPAPAPAASMADPATKNQQLAEAIAGRLASSTVSEGADISLITEGGTVTVTGPCQSDEQKLAILGEIRVVPGVTLVKDGLVVGGMIRQTQGFGPVSGAPPMGVMPPLGANPMPGMPDYNGPIAEPLPVGGGGGYAGAAPPLPPYAWPTYAPHNNVSRVGYPQSYPYNAFPFIGPFYPFPKVPLGWRSVNLTWEDGHWFLGRTSVPHDYWRTRFW